MTTRLLKSGLALLLLLSAALANPTEKAPPKEVAARFYRTLHKLKISGLPNAQEAKLLAPFLSPDLQKLMQVAKRKQAEFSKEHPAEKPPWIEGDLFSSLFEGAHGSRIGTPVLQDERAEVPVHLFYCDGKKLTRWSDTLVLTRTAKGWMVSDILYKASWDFKPSTSLRGVLQAE